MDQRPQSTPTGRRSRAARLRSLADAATTPKVREYLREMARKFEGLAGNTGEDAEDLEQRLS